jgi:hypothetical protein
MMNLRPPAVVLLLRRHRCRLVRRLLSSATSSSASSYVHPALSLRPSSGCGGRGWFCAEDLPAGTLVLRERPLAAAQATQDLPAAVARAVAKVPSLAEDLSLLQPPPSPEQPLGDKEHAARVCAVNATHALNADDFAPFSETLSSDPLALSLNPGGSSADGGDGTTTTRPRRSPGGVCLPVRRSLLNHSCEGNVATVYVGDGESLTCEVRTTANVPAGEEVRRRAMQCIRELLDAILSPPSIEFSHYS